MNDARPDPDALLRTLKRGGEGTGAHSEATQGRLKVYLGAAPGVGKTFKMLTDAAALREAGDGAAAGAGLALGDWVVLVQASKDMTRLTELD